MKNFIFAVATAIAAFAFNSCSDTVEASMDLIINANEAQNQELEIITKHESSEHVDNIVYDYHIAALISGNVEFENQRYSATHELNVSDATFKRSIATNLQETTIYFNSDTEEFDLAGTKVCAYAELTDCESVTFELNGNCYCHPKFAQNGAIARLDCCPIVPVRMETGKINGNIFTAEVIFKADSEVRYSVEFAIIDEDVYAYEYDEYVTVTENGTATLNEYETKNGVRTGKVNTLKGEFKASLKAGVEIVKTSDNNPTLNNVIPTISENMASFSYTLGEDTFFDGWTMEIPSDVAFTTSNGEQIRRPFEFKWVVKSESFTGNNGTWSNKASLSIPKNQDEVIKISSDTQVIRISAPESDVYAYEYDEYVTVTGNGTATLNEYETKNGVRTGKVNTLKGEFKASLKAGVEIVKTSDNNPTLNNVIPTISENMASFSYTLGEDTFFDGWTMEIPSDVAFTTSNGEQIRRPFEFKWVVKSESFTGNNGTWSNKASLSIPKNQDEVIKISSDTQVIRVVTNVYGYEYADTVTVTGNGTATLKEYETLNGARTGKVNILEGTFSVSFAASSEIVKTSTNTPSLLSTIGNINGNNVSFSYTLDNTSFTDNWFASLPSKVEFVTSDGNSISRSFSDSWVVMSTSFTQNGNVWMNTAELSIANYVCASDTQYIRIEAVKGYEHDNFATVLSSTEVGLNVYPTVNGYRTGEVIIVKGYYSATLTAGAMLERSSKEALMLNNKSANVSGNNASFNYSLGNESVNDEWKYSASASANFTLPDNSAVNIPIQATYSVMSTDFRLNNDVYSNTASLYAGNIAVASDVQQIKVEVPVEALIDGYTAISAYITTCYYSENKTLIKDGNHLVIVFRNNTDNAKYIVRQTVSTTSTVGTDFAFSNLNENAVYSKIKVDGKWVPAYLDVISEKNVAVQWGYTQINGNSEFPINRMAVTTGGLTNPIIEKGKVVNGIVTINGLKIK